MPILMTINIIRSNFEGRNFAQGRAVISFIQFIFNLENKIDAFVRNYNCKNVRTERRSNNKTFAYP